MDDESTEFDAEITEATEQRATMTATLKAIRHLIDNVRLVIECRGDASLRPVVSAAFDGPTRIVLALTED